MSARLVAGDLAAALFRDREDVRDLRGPDFFFGVVTAICPGGKEDAVETAETIVIAVLVAAVRRGSGLVGLCGCDFHGCGPRQARIKRGLIPDVRLQTIRIADRVVINDAERTGNRIHCHRLVVLVVQ